MMTVAVAAVMRSATALLLRTGIARDPCLLPSGCSLYCKCRSLFDYEVDSEGEWEGEAADDNVTDLEKMSAGEEEEEEEVRGRRRRWWRCWCHWSWCHWWCH